MSQVLAKDTEGSSGSSKSLQELNDQFNTLSFPVDYSIIEWLVKKIISDNFYSCILIFSKTVLVSPSEEQFELLKKRLEERINDSRGETIYQVGAGGTKITFT